MFVASLLFAVALQWRKRRRLKDQHQPVEPETPTRTHIVGDLGNRLRKYVNVAVNNDSVDKSNHSRRPRLLLCATGSVATVKVPELANRFCLAGYDVIVVVTAAAKHMLENVAPSYNPVQWEQFQSLVSANHLKSDASTVDAPEEGGRILGVLEDYDEWSNYTDVRNDTVLHIDLRKWTDMCLVAPMSTNTLAKASNGLSDNLLSCILRAWDFRKPIFAAPAANT